MSSLEPSRDEAVEEHKVGVQFDLDLWNKSIHLTSAVPGDLREYPCKREWI